MSKRNESLTIRQTQVLQSAAIGMTAKEQARHLGLSVETLKTHRVACLDRLCAANITQAVYLAAKRGLI